MTSFQQDQVDRLLRRGVFFSIFWLMGVGSAIAVINAVKAKRMIDASQGKLKGQGKIRWCFIVGGLGLLWWVYVVVMVVKNVVMG